MVLFLIEHFIIYNLFFIDTESCQEFNQVNFQILKPSNSHYVTHMTQSNQIIQSRLFKSP
jgi:hypothetical protein